jgi:hypothetical protein
MSTVSGRASLRCCHSRCAPSTRIHLRKNIPDQTAITVCGEAVRQDLPYLPVSDFAKAQPLADWCTKCAKLTERARTVSGAA